MTKTKLLFLYGNINFSIGNKGYDDAVLLATFVSAIS
jgi:hypothetical protein